MNITRAISVVGLISALTSYELAFAHGGGLNASGCHNDRKRGTYHCHRSSYTPKSAYSGTSGSSSYKSRSSGSTSYSSGYLSGSTYGAQKLYAIQSLLTHLGYNPGSIDGKMGQNTKAAIEKFQKDNLLLVNGTPNDSLLYELSKKLAATKH